MFSISEHSVASSFKLPTKWPQTEVKVCFIDHSTKNLRPALNSYQGEILDEELFSIKEKKFIKNTVNSNFSSEETKIIFIGWENCETSNNNIDIIIDKGTIYKNTDSRGVPKSSIGGSSSIGNSPRQVEGFGEVGGYIKFLIGEPHPQLVSYQSREERFFDTVLHEFSHAAGLRHEHERIESLNDEWCQFSNVTQTRSFRTGELYSKEYDPVSITNYCYGISLFRSPNRIRRYNGLSPIDKNTLKCVYSDYIDEASCQRANLVLY